MAVKSMRELFLYELSILRDGESAGRQLLEFLALHASGDDLVQILRAQEQVNKEDLANLNSCLEALGYSTTAAVSEPVEGIHRRFEECLRIRPAPDILDQFAVDTAIRYFGLGIASYKALLDWAILMAESQCAKSLYANLIHKQESASTLERLSHEIGVRLCATA